MSLLSDDRHWLEQFDRFEDVLQKYPLPPRHSAGCQLHRPGGLGYGFALELNGQWVHMIIHSTGGSLESVTLYLEST